MADCSRQNMKWFAHRIVDVIKILEEQPLYQHHLNNEVCVDMALLVA